MKRSFVPVAAAASGPAEPCPAGVADLQRASGRPRGDRVGPAHIRCARRWATAGVVAADQATEGDGVILFEHKAGRWTRVAEGSALECTPYGIPDEIGDRVGCRDH